MNPMQLRLAALLWLLFPLGMTWAESKQDEAEQWLGRMIEGTQSLNYEGTFVYVQGHNLEAMHVIRASAEEGVRQRLASLTGRAREVVVTNQGVICLLPKRKIIFNGAKFNHPFSGSLPWEPDRLKRHYRFTIIGDDRVAARKTRVIAIKPRDELRFGYRLWLDYDTGLVLRSALLGERGEVIEQLMFTDLQVKQEIDADQLILPEAAELVAPKVKHSPEPVTQSNWTVSRLPEGFAQILHNRFTTISSKYPTEHMVFTDGLATISVFLERLDGAKPLLSGASQMGAVNAFGAVINDHQVLVVGEVPQATVEMIAAALQYTD